MNVYLAGEIHTNWRDDLITLCNKKKLEIKWRNLAIENCNTNWVVILDHDDTMFPDRLKIHYENILKNPNKKIF